MAFHDVNNNKDLLSGYYLKLHWFDSEVSIVKVKLLGHLKLFIHLLMISNFLQCEPGRGASAMYQLLYNDPTKVFLLAGCSTVCTTVAEAAKKWNLIVVSSHYETVF